MTPTVIAGTIARYPLGLTGITGIAVTTSSVWVATWDLGLVVRVDLGTGLMAERVPIGLAHQGPQRIAYGQGWLWVLDASTNSIMRLNPVTGAILGRTASPVGMVDGLAIGDGFVWVTTNAVTLASAAGDHLLKLDPATGRVLAVAALPGDGVGASMVVPGPGGVWVGGASPVTLELDPATLHVIRTVSATVQSGFVMGTDVVWLATGRQLLSIERSTGALLDTIDVPGGTLAQGPDGTVWVAGSTLQLLDPRTRRVYMVVPSLESPVSLASDGTTLWAYSGTDLVELAPPALPP